LRVSKYWSSFEKRGGERGRNGKEEEERKGKEGGAKERDEGERKGRTKGRSGQMKRTQEIQGRERY
jgi:hypothetical protein